MGVALALALVGQGRAIQAVEDNHAGGSGSKLAEAAAVMGREPRIHSLAVRNMPESERIPDAVLAYVHFAVSDIVAAAAGPAW
jgi:hypothetical protein